MRIFSITVLGITMSVCFIAHAEEPADTVVFEESASNIVVTQKGNVTRVTADVVDDDGMGRSLAYEVDVDRSDSISGLEIDDDWGLKFTFYQSKPSSGRKVRRSVVGLKHTYAGWRFNYGGKGDVKNCFELGIREVVGIDWTIGERGKSSTFNIGLGFGFQRYLARNGFAYAKEDDKIFLSPVPEGVKVETSRMDVYNFQVPVSYSQEFAKYFNFTLGVVANFNSYASAVTEIYDGSTKHRIKFKGLQQNLFTADLFVSLGWNEGVGVYFSWSPMSIYKRCYGPEMKAWSIGIDLFTF